MSFWDDKPRKRTLGTRDKQILLERAGYKCEACGKTLTYSEMQVGHKNAYSKGGSTARARAPQVYFIIYGFRETSFLG